MVPLYDVFCELTGFNGKTSGRYLLYDQTVSEKMLSEKTLPAKTVSDQTTSEQPADIRQVRVQFLANNNTGMPWEFRAGQRAMTVVLGEMNAAEFYVRNNTDSSMTAQAIPSVTPFKAAEYLHKTECFCFSQQTLAPGEALTMPLRFILGDELPADVKKLTLAYTLYDVTPQVDDSADNQNRLAVSN